MTFARLAGRMVREQLFYRNVVVFAQELDCRPPIPVSAVEGLGILRCRSWDEVPDATQVVLTTNRLDFWWDSVEWIRRGWTLWLGMMGDELAGIVWTRTPAQSADFFVPIDPDGGVIWQSVILPHFRRRGIFTHVLWHVLQQMRSEGVRIAYISSLESNVPSKRAFKRCGFRRIGHASRWQAGGSWRWYPEANSGADREK